MIDLQNYYIAQLNEVYGEDGTRALVSRYRNAFMNQEDVLRDLASFARVAEPAPPQEVERTEGRREMFWRIMALIEADPVRVAQFLNGDNLDN